MTRQTPAPSPALLALALLLPLALAACGDARPMAAAPATAPACSVCHLSAATLAADRAAGSGAHAAHVLGGAVAGPLGCAECHRVPAAIDAPGHADGRVDLAFSGRAGGAGARFDPASRTCAVACHGAARPVWTQVDGSWARCGSCHGTPPPAPHAASAACAACHPATVRSDGTLNVPGGAHLNGRIDAGGDVVAACGTCHGLPPGGRHPASTTCGSCHPGYGSRSVNAALHMNGATDVLPVEAICGACHAVPPPPPHPATTLCGACHPGYTATAVNAAVHRNGAVDVRSQACGACHAIPPATGEHGEHVGEGISCGRCHPGASPTSGGDAHVNGVVNVSAPGWNPATRSCANACHGSERWDGWDGRR